MSVSSVSLSSDANVRYQRLAQEYAKLRAQAKVLREGVLEERSKADKLVEEVKSKEAVIRRLQSENESLTFRNEQLTVRVEHFQVQALKPSSTPSGAHQKTSDPNLEILEQELRRKLTENEQLVSKLAESERQHAVEMAEMSEKLAREMRKLEEEVRTMRMKTCKNQKADDVKILNSSVSQKNSEAPGPEFSEISSPEPPESHEEAKFMVAEAARGAFFAFHNVFSLLQQRSEVYPYDVTMERLPAHVEKLSSEYAQTARLFSDLTAILDAFLTSSEPLDVSAITSKCRLISQHCHQMLTSLVIQMTCEESKVTWCTPPLAALNEEWQKLMLRMFEVFERLTEQDEDVVPYLETLEDVVLRMVDCFQKRWVFEARLPTTTRRMRCVGQALEKAIQMMAQETSKLHARAKRVQMMSVVELAEPKEPEELLEPEKEAPELNEHTNPFESDSEDSEDSEDVKNTNAPSDDVKKEETPEFTSEYTPELTPKSQNPESTLQTAQTTETTENPPKFEEIQIWRQKYEELQKERDKLFVEFSLCKRKLEISTNEGVKMEKTDMEMIWDIGMQQRDQWMDKVENAEMTVKYYENELKLLLRHGRESEKHMKKIVSEMDQLSRANQKLEDELESVRRSYESQLGDLSDHLANLVNEKEKEKEGNKSRGSLKSFFNKSSS